MTVLGARLTGNFCTDPICNKKATDASCESVSRTGEVGELTFCGVADTNHLQDQKANRTMLNRIQCATSIYPHANYVGETLYLTPYKLMKNSDVTRR